MKELDSIIEKQILDVYCIEIKMVELIPKFLNHVKKVSLVNILNEEVATINNNIDYLSLFLKDYQITPTKSSCEDFDAIINIASTFLNANDEIAHNSIIASLLPIHQYKTAIYNSIFRMISEKNSVILAKQFQSILHHCYEVSTTLNKIADEKRDIQTIRRLSQ